MIACGRNPSPLCRTRRKQFFTAGSVTTNETDCQHGYHVS